MRKLIFVLSLAVLTSLLMNFKPVENNKQLNISNSTTLSSNISDKFIIGIMNGGYDTDWGNLEDYKVNLWHHYPNVSNKKTQIQGWTRHVPQDLLFEPLVPIYRKYSTVPKTTL